LYWGIDKEGSAETGKLAGCAFKEEVIGLLKAVAAEAAAALKGHESGAVLGA
jgi:hypothetical protein